MLEDLIALTILFAIGWRFYPDQFRGLRISAPDLSKLAQHRYYRFGVGLVLVQFAGLLVILGQFGFRDSFRLLMGNSPGDPQCYVRQEYLRWHIRGSLSEARRDSDWRCPRGEAFEIRGERFYCPTHGYAPDQRKK
jgi:hypothetical protein